MTSREFIYTMAKEAAAYREMEKQAKLRGAFSAARKRVAGDGRKAIAGLKRYIQLMRGGRDYADFVSMSPAPKGGAKDALKRELAAVAKTRGRTLYAGGASAATAGGLALGNKLRKSDTEEKVASAQALDYLTQVALARRARR